MPNAFDSAGLDELDAVSASLIRRRDTTLGSAYRLFYARPLRFTRGEGVYLYDGDGHAYLDAYNNVPSVGHCHPRVAEAIARQAATLNVHTRYLTDGIIDYAERLLATHARPAGARHPTGRCSPAPEARPTTWHCGSRGTTQARPASS